MRKITSENYDLLLEQTADILEIEKKIKFREFLGRVIYGASIAATSQDYDHEVHVNFSLSDIQKMKKPSLRRTNISLAHEVNSR